MADGKKREEENAELAARCKSAAGFLSLPPPRSARRVNRDGLGSVEIYHRGTEVTERVMKGRAKCSVTRGMTDANRAWRQNSGERIRPECWRRRPAVANFSQRSRDGDTSSCLESRSSVKFVSAGRRNQRSNRAERDSLPKAARRGGAEAPRKRARSPEFGAHA